MIDELEEMEKYNREFSQRMSARETKNLITCTHCKGSGGFFSAVSWPEYRKCDHCGGTGYVETIKNKPAIKGLYAATTESTITYDDSQRGWTCLGTY